MHLLQDPVRHAQSPTAYTSCMPWQTLPCHHHRMPQCGSRFDSECLEISCYCVSKHTRTRAHARTHTHTYTHHIHTRAHTHICSSYPFCSHPLLPFLDHLFHQSTSKTRWMCCECHGRWGAFVMTVCNTEPPMKVTPNLGVPLQHHN